MKTREYFLTLPVFLPNWDAPYERFFKNPQELYHLKPRQLEILLDGIFRNNGCKTQLGSGQADGGIDIRLYSNDVIGEVVTLVQIKRYAPTIPIKLEAVQALTAIVEDERANRGLFVTTSRYLPSVNKFAARQNGRIKLANSNDVGQWCFDAAKKIIRDKSYFVKPDYVKSLLNTKDSSNTLEGKIFHADTGYSMKMNSFAIVLRESKGAALLMTLPSIKVSGNEYQGDQMPCTEVSAILEFLDINPIFRAKKGYKNNGDIYFWANQKMYLLWDGKPKWYDYCD